MKLNEMLIDAFVVSFLLLEPFKRPCTYEITFGRRPQREERARAIFLSLKKNSLRFTSFILFFVCFCFFSSAWVYNILNLRKL